LFLTIKLIYQMKDEIAVAHLMTLPAVIGIE